MADIADIADKDGEFLTEIAMQNRRRLPLASEPFCIECGIDIPMERRIAINAIRCVDCQTDYERIN